jgi:hypothetical protein
MTVDTRKNIELGDVTKHNVMVSGDLYLPCPACKWIAVIPDGEEGE